jgi:hypothetical protein
MGYLYLSSGVHGMGLERENFSEVSLPISYFPLFPYVDVKTAADDYYRTKYCLLVG